jgi:hypothetical protein
MTEVYMVCAITSFYFHCAEHIAVEHRCDDLLIFLMDSFYYLFMFEQRLFVKFYVFT